jgi:type I restriction enzyme, S subunit
MGELREVKIEELIESANTGLDAIKRAPIVSNDTGIKCLRIQDVSQKKLYNDWGFCDVTDNNYKKFQLRKGDILIARTGASIGVNMLIKNDLNSVFNNGLIRLRVDKTKTTPEFVFYQFRSSYYRSYIESISGGTSTQPNMQINALLDFEVNVPELPEQNTIVSILSSLDDKIDLLHRQNKTLEALAETLFRQWFVENKIWDGKLSEYIKVQGGYAFKSQDFREIGFTGIIKITNITMGSVDIINTQFVDEEVVKDIEEEKFRAKTGDFLIAMTGAEIGKIGMVEKTETQIWVNQRVGKLVEKVSYGNIVGYLALKSREGQDHIINTCSGSAQENISSSGIEGMDFTKYSEKEVNGFGLEAKPLFEKILFNMNQIRTLTQLRDTLLPKLMSGEVRVKI